MGCEGSHNGGCGGRGAPVPIIFVFNRRYYVNSIKLALKHLNFNLHSDVDFQTETGRNSSIEVTATGITFMMSTILMIGWI